MHHEKKIYLIFYVDDVKLIESDEHAFDEISCQIAEHFKIMNKDQIHHYLNMKIEVDHQNQMICLSQKIYIKQLLKQFSMQNCSLTSILMMYSLQILNQSFRQFKIFIVKSAVFIIIIRICIS